MGRASMSSGFMDPVSSGCHGAACTILWKTAHNHFCFRVDPLLHVGLFLHDVHVPRKRKCFPWVTVTMSVCVLVLSVVSELSCIISQTVNEAYPSGSVTIIIKLITTCRYEFYLGRSIFRVFTISFKLKVVRAEKFLYALWCTPIIVCALLLTGVWTIMYCYLGDVWNLADSSVIVTGESMKGAWWNVILKL